MQQHAMYQLSNVAVIRMRPLGEINGDSNGRTAKEDGTLAWMIIIPRDVVQNPLSKQITTSQSRKNNHRPSMPEANDQVRAVSWLLRTRYPGYNTFFHGHVAESVLSKVYFEHSEHDVQNTTHGPRGYRSKCIVNGLGITTRAG
jgi:hypothetical protein